MLNKQKTHHLLGSKIDILIARGEKVQIFANFWLQTRIKSFSRSDENQVMTSFQ
jgi:hypothetical protein